MRGILIMILVTGLSAASAEVYRWVDKDGVVHFGDEPVQGAETIKVPPMQTITSIPLHELEQRRKAPNLSGPYSELKVISPAQDEAIRANSGAVSIQLALNPGLLGGHQLMVNVDGTQRPLQGLSMNLSNLPRGAHTVSAQVKNAQGKVLISSNKVNFFVLRVRK